MKYELSSDKFIGRGIILEYSDETGFLIKFEIDAKLTIEQNQFLFTRFPVTTDLLTSLKNTSTTLRVKIVDETIDFQMFWDVYRKKEGIEAAKKAWEKIIKKGDQRWAYLGAKKYAYKYMCDNTFQLQASTFLNKERYKDYPLDILR